MNINLDDLSSTEVYYTMTETLVPRPIAWVLSENIIKEKSFYHLNELLTGAIMRPVNKT